MTGRLASLWQIRTGSDWVTAVDGSSADLMAVGSRNGNLALVDRYGTVVGEGSYGSWIGALRLVVNPVRRSATRTTLWIGTKAGDIVCSDVTSDGPSGYRIQERFRYKARNTIREIAISPEGPHGRVVAAGSEDRCVYLVSHEQALSDEATQPIRHETNGWIRSVAFCRSPTGTPLVAAGCGNKYLYFLSTAGKPVGETWVDAKIHSIAADERSPRVYCTSDARQLHIIGWRGTKPDIIGNIRLPHRATRLIWSDNRHNTLLAICEDETIYAFDVQVKRIVGHVSAGERVFAASVPDLNRSGSLMLGFANGRLLSCNYALASGLPAQPARGTEGFGRDLTEEGLDGLAEAIFYGPKTATVEVGIGRFVDIAPASRGKPALCVVGTDEGTVAIIPLVVEAERRAATVLSEYQPERVWAVRAQWTRDDRLALDVATSGRNVTRQQLAFDADWKATVVESDTLALADWPREIRSLEGLVDDEPPLIVACEDGALHVVGLGDPIATDEILRTVAGQATSSGVRIVTGSDDNFVTQYDDGQHTWRFPTDDRVREVLLEGEQCVAVSEDRFAYVLDADGTLVRRFRFPHRALCVSAHPSVDGEPCFVIGCGDGSVYVLAAAGGVVGRYAFPDRIRDVRVVDDRELIVACEDRSVYFAPVMTRYLADHFGSHLDVVEDAVSDLRTPTSGILALNAMRRDAQLLLLRYFDHWCEHADSELALALLDAAEDVVRVEGHPLAATVYARALLVLAQRVSVPAALARLSSITASPDTSSYATHAVITAVLSAEPLDRQLAEPATPPTILVDTLLESARLDDGWVREELLRALADSGFLDSTPQGFVQLGTAMGIRFSVLNAVVQDAQTAQPRSVRDCGLVRELRRLSEPISAVRAPRDVPVAPTFAEWEAGLAAARDAASHSAAARALGDWLQIRVREAAISTWALDWLASDLVDLESGRARFRHVAERFSGECMRRDERVTGSAFISALAFRHLLETLGQRYDKIDSEAVPVDS